MTEPAAQPANAKPRRTVLPIALWTGAILLVLGLAWFVGAVVIPVHRAKRVVRDVIDLKMTVKQGVDALGGPERAGLPLQLYARLPKDIVSRPMKGLGAATYMLAYCGRPAVPACVSMLRSSDSTTRYMAACCLSDMGAEAADAIDALERATADPEGSVGDRAREALDRIRGNEPNRVKAWVDQQEAELSP